MGRGPDLTVRLLRTAIVATATPGAKELALTLTGTIGGVSLIGADVVKLVNGVATFGSDRVMQVYGASGEEIALAIRGVTPNPATAGGGLTVRLTLAGEALASLDVLDLSGRRVLRQDLAGLGRGTHQFALAGARRLAPGVYWMRLTQGEESRKPDSPRCDRQERGGATGPASARRGESEGLCSRGAFPSESRVLTQSFMGASRRNSSRRASRD